MADQVECRACGEPVPDGPFCVRCGAPLAGADHTGPSRGRSQFAAAPHERLHAPWIVSTLFPHLPRASLAGFRGALIGGVAAVVALAALRLFPVALIAAATLVPVLTLIYLHEVHVYEDEPPRVLALTMAWGTLAGVGVGLLGREVGEVGAGALAASRGHIVLVQGVALPLLGLALAFAGPLVLLRRRQFDDVLDGATFGAACGAALAGAQVITYGASLLGGGLRPDGDVAAWIVQVLAIAVASPVLTMAVLGTACAALWLRFRAPMRDRGALGPLSHPVVAVGAAAILVAGGAVLQVILPQGWWLLALSGLAAVALIGLRRAIHLGLLEEAAEIPIGPAFQCANCGAETPAHTFCINCGISRQAMPKPREQRPAAPEENPGEAPA